MLASLALWAGTTTLVTDVRWFRRRALTDRLRPYTPGAAAPTRGTLTAASFRDILKPLATDAGERLSRLFGVTEALERRLERFHSPLDASAFRLRQLGAALAGFGLGAVLLLVARPPVTIGVVVLLGVPLLTFLLAEQRVSARSDAWKRRVVLELPLVSEQLAMLVSAGYSLSGAMVRIAERGRGACAEDLRTVIGRVHHGLGEAEALREWSSRVRVDALDRLVPILALNQASTDLGRLISEEARGIRRDAHRDLLQLIEKRAQSVWIPVTVATLVPGVILLAIPFSNALRLFTAG